MQSVRIGYLFSRIICSLDLYNSFSWVAIRSLHSQNSFCWIAIRSLDLHNSFPRIAICSLDCFLGLQFIPSIYITCSLGLQLVSTFYTTHSLGLHPNEWKIIRWEEKTQTNTNKKLVPLIFINRSLGLQFFLFSIYTTRSLKIAICFLDLHKLVS